jgi:hypothetical protein
MLRSSGIYSNHIKTISRKFRSIREKLRSFHPITETNRTSISGHLISFDVVSLFANVPIEESVQIIKTKLDTDQEKNTTFQPENKSDYGTTGSF